MKPASTLLREARLEAGLTQASLAGRAGMPQSVVARLEHAGSNPTWETMDRLLSVTDHELRLRKRARSRSSIDETLVFENLRLSPGERLQAFERSYANAREFALAARESLGRPA